MEQEYGSLASVKPSYKNPASFPKLRLGGPASILMKYAGLKIQIMNE